MLEEAKKQLAVLARGTRQHVGSEAMNSALAVTQRGEKAPRRTTFRVFALKLGLCI
jgi:hypothetical protein